MPEWTPSQIWPGEDAYVIGGGDSLFAFDWELIRGLNTVGCNSRYTLGADLCKVTVFGDKTWWDSIGKKGTEDYGGMVVCACPKLKDDPTPWLLKMKQNDVAGLGRSALGWHGNTGSLAINLALILGAKRVFLLGFDMDREYHRQFCKQMIYIPMTLPEMFPGCEIWNVTDDSKMELFPTVSLEEHFTNTREGVK